MKLQHCGVSYNGGVLEKDTFAFIHAGVNPVSGIVFHCRGNPPRPRICQVTIQEGEPANGVHGWDGNKVEPTITPSIGCASRKGCSWHGNITKGDFTP